MSKQLIKRGIILVSVLIVLIVSFALWFGMISNAWFKENRTSYFTTSHIYSITQGEANNMASFKNENQFDADLDFEDINGDFTERFIPGDLLFYTFIVSNIDVASSQTYVMELVDVDAAAVGAESDAVSFVNNCVIEPNTIKMAVLERFGDMETGYYELYPYDSEDNSFYDVNQGLLNAGINFEDCLQTTTGTATTNLEIKFTFTIPSGVTYPAPTNGSAAGSADLIIIIPIWYMDTSLNQNIEMDCSLTIAGCIVYPYTGGGQ